MIMTMQYYRIAKFSSSIMKLFLFGSLENRKRTEILIYAKYKSSPSTSFLTNMQHLEMASNGKTQRHVFVTRKMGIVSSNTLSFMSKSICGTIKEMNLSWLRGSLISPVKPFLTTFGASAPTSGHSCEHSYYFILFFLTLYNLH